MSNEVIADEHDDAWDEGKLGRDEKFVRRSSIAREKEVEDLEGLQMISLRLQRELIEQLKFIANHHGVGYQPLMRDVLSRFARSEILLVAKQMQEQMQAQEIIASAAPKKKKRA